MSNRIQIGLKKTLASVTMVATMLSIGGFAAIPTRVLAVAPADYGLTEGNTISAVGSNDPDIYIVNQAGYKRIFVNPAIFNLYGHLSWAGVKAVATATRDAFGTSALFKNCESGDPKVWALEVVSEDVANLHWVNVSGADAVSQDPNFFAKVFCINNAEVALYGAGAPYTALSQIPVYVRGGASPTPGSGGLNGTVGSLASVEEVGALSAEEVGEGENDVPVHGIDIEAGNSSDIRLLAVKVKLSKALESKDLEDYVSDVSLWLDGNKIAELDPEDFDETSNIFTQSIALSGDTVILADDTRRLQVSVSALSNLDSADQNEDWTINIQEVRYVDAQNAITTDSTTGDLETSETFQFEDFATAAGIELEMKEDDANNPESSVVEVASESDTDGVLLLAGTLKAKNGDILVEELAFDISTSSADLDNIASDLTLEIDGDEVQTINTTSSDCTAATVTECTFDDVDFEIDSNDTVPFRLLANVNGTEDHAEGSRVTANITNDSDTVAEDMNGDALASGDKTGSVTGEAQEFRSWGIQLALVSATESKVSGDAVRDEGTFTIKLNVTSFGGDVYLQEGCSGDLATSGSFEFVLKSGSTASVSSSCTLQASDNSIDDSSTNGNFKVIVGQTEEFTLTVVELGTDTFVSVRLEGVDWATGDIADPATFYEFNLEDFKTDDLFLSST